MNFVKFIQIKTTLSSEEFNKLVSKTISENDIASIARLYSKFRYIEYIDSDGLECMVAIIHQNYIGELLKIYIDASIKFEYEDLSKAALYTQISTKNFTTEMMSLLKRYVTDNTDVDTILDKILELGKETLTENDIHILESQK